MTTTDRRLPTSPGSSLSTRDVSARRLVDDGRPDSTFDAHVDGLPLHGHVVPLPMVGPHQ